MNKKLSSVKCNFFLSRSPEETRKLGKILGGFLTGGDLVALCGELGSGKTEFTKGISRGLQVPENYLITSPTFTLINEYPGRFPLYHFDLYRLSSSLEIEELGYEEYFYAQGVTIIEWAQKILDLLPEQYLMIRILYLKYNLRKFEITGMGRRYLEIIEKLKEIIPKSPESATGINEDL